MVTPCQANALAYRHCSSSARCLANHKTSSEDATALEALGTLVRCHTNLDLLHQRLHYGSRLGLQRSALNYKPFPAQRCF